MWLMLVLSNEVDLIHIVINRLDKFFKGKRKTIITQQTFRSSILRLGAERILVLGRVIAKEVSSAWGSERSRTRWADTTWRTLIGRDPHRSDSTLRTTWTTTHGRRSSLRHSTLRTTHHILSSVHAHVGITSRIRSALTSAHLLLFIFPPSLHSINLELLLKFIFTVSSI